MALGPIGNQEEGKKFRKEWEDKDERSKGKTRKTQKGSKNMEPQKCKLHFWTPVNRWYAPRHIERQHMESTELEMHAAYEKTINKIIKCPCKAPTIEWYRRRTKYKERSQQ